MRTPIGRAVLLGAALAAVVSCGDSPTEPTEQRVLGLVATPAGGLWFPGIEANPRAWIVEERHIRIEITTEGACEVVRPDWEVTISDGFIGTPAFIFILPYEVRATGCHGPPTAQRPRHPVTIFTDTLDVVLDAALEATVRVVSRDGQVFDRELDLHPGWPLGGG